MRVNLGADRRVAMDWLPVFAVAAVSQLAIGLEQPWTGSDLGRALSSLLLALPLLWRRSHPLLTAGLVAAALPAQVALGGSLHFGSFCAILVAAFAVGRHAGSWRRTLVGALLTLAGALLASADGLRQAPSDAVFPLFYIGAAAALGLLVRRESRQAEHLRSLNAALERERDSAARLAVATERLRLARELHDVVAHHMMVMVIQAEAAEASIRADPEAARRSIVRVQEAGRGGLVDLRSIVGLMRGGDGPAPPGLGDIDALVAVLGDGGLDVEVERRGDLAGLPAPLAAEVFRVVQESLTNVVKHSAARGTTVRVERTGATVEVVVTDPGPAAAPGAVPSGGHGIAGMTERVSAWGGTLSAEPWDGGFRVCAQIPLEGAEGDLRPSVEAAP